MSEVSAVMTFEAFARQEAQQYMPDHLAAKILEQTGAFTVSSVVAGGKNTICDLLVTDDFCGFCVSHTTREVEDRDRINPSNPESYPTAYAFVDREHMVGKLLAYEMLEVAVVHGNIYGTSLDALQAVAGTGRRPLLEIDMQGVTKLQTVYEKLPSFFIVPPNPETWLQRWAARDTSITRDLFDKRVASAITECDMAMKLFTEGRMTFIANNHAQIAADSIVSALENGASANQETRYRALQNFKTTVAVQSDGTDVLWEEFKRVQKNN
jgi:guanylate kinase